MTVKKAPWRKDPLNCPKHLPEVKLFPVKIVKKFCETTTKHVRNLVLTVQNMIASDFNLSELFFK
jgi:hypothetical protein